MRRWRVVVIDDNPEGSLEAVLLAPLVLAQPLMSDVSTAEMEAAVVDNLIDRYLPLEPGQRYAAVADVDFQVRSFEERRSECGRHPMIEVERDFARAWKFVAEMAETPPDIIFLDVMFDMKTSAVADLQAIVDEIHLAERIGRDGKPTILEVLSRGGLFLLGRMLRFRKEARRMPLVVLYSASRDVQSDFRPFEYAFGGQFEVVEKDLLRNSSIRRNAVFRRRIRDYFLDGTIRPEDVRCAIQLLGSEAAIRGDQQAITRGFSQSIGGGWCFGALFVAECVAYLSAEPARRDLVLAELEEFIAPLTARARSLVDLMQNSPARLFTHIDGSVTFESRPAWLSPAGGIRINGNGAVKVSLRDLRGDVCTIQAELEDAVRRLPKPLREALEKAYLEEAAATPGQTSEEEPSLDALLGSMVAYDRRWDALLNKCRMALPAALISHLIAKEAKEGVTVEGITPEMLEGKWDRAAMVELFLAPSSDPVKNPLADLLRAIVDGVRRHGGGKRTLGLNFQKREDLSALEIVLRDFGVGFSGLSHYELKGGDLSTALSAAAEWFDITIASGGIQRRIASRGVGPPEPSDVTRGTSFSIRIPAYRCPKEA